MDEELDAPKTPAQPEKKGGAGMIIALVLLTLIGGAGGGGLALMQVDTIAAAAEKRANEAPPKVDDALAWSEESAVVELDPVISNLGQPSTTWIRLETALVFNKESVDDVDRLTSEVEQDVLGFLRTLTVGELQGASALNHLRDDLNERARLATNGAVSELIIESMVLQ